VQADSIDPVAACPFCTPNADKVFYESLLVVGLWDGFPVSPGHALLVPRRHVASWFDATDAEKAALMTGIDAAKATIEAAFSPSAYNIGINVGCAAGQTVFHLHVHVIPRYVDDVPDPRGGVRHVIPGKANYLRHAGTTEAHAPLLIHGGKTEPLLPHVKRQLATAVTVDIAVAFVLRSGVDLLQNAMAEALDRGARVRVLTGDYLDATDPVALRQLLDFVPRTGASEIRVYQTRTTVAPDSMPRAFHPKAYIFRHADGTGTAFIGSSNLSRSALQDGVEWNYRIVASRDGEGFGEVQQAFEHLFSSPATIPLTTAWIDAYRQRRSLAVTAKADEAVATPAPEPLEVPKPHSIQKEALEALRNSRRDGRTSGLVVLATGLGKTWLSAFDSTDFARVLFVAHREEILDQALRTYRRIRPQDHLGRYTGDDKRPDAAVLFASIQTLGKQAHLERFPSTYFDYIVIDEFHHASAATYRRLLQHFTPKYLLGLTATPERSDGADLLDLCDGNLVFRCDLAAGVEEGLLCPFDYYGVPDEVDYRNIPWRSRKFDETELTAAVATVSRAQNALEQLNTRGGRRTLAFCVSTGHADFMAAFFRQHGKRAVAVHSGPSSAPRTVSLEQLQAGELDVVCAVDMFNEGVDLPDLDTVMMLRPTESRILWLQQFGRGLRKAAADKRLKVIDYIGNHRTFLLKPQTLFGLPAGDQNILNLIEQYQAGTLALPPGCSVVYDLAAIDILKKLVRAETSPSEALRAYVQDFVDLHGMRPTALETYRDGYAPRAVRKNFGSWPAFLMTLEVLSPEQRQALAVSTEFLSELEVTPMTRSFKMVTLLAMVNADAFPGAISIDALVAGVRALAARHSHIAADFGGALETDRTLRAHLEKNPIAAWTGHTGAVFTYGDGVFSSRIADEPGIRTALQELTREIAEWRLAEYFDRPTVDAGSYLIKVNQSSGTPILMPLNRAANPGLPEGWTTFRAGDTTYHGNFVSIALNVAEREGSSKNDLPALLRGWFGPDAGAPGTRHHVTLSRAGDGWVMAPTGVGIVAPTVWKAYAREQIPALFGLPFNASIWQQGFVRRDKLTFLLVTLDRSTPEQEHNYLHHFESPTDFQWQSQNRTAQASEHGQSIRDHRTLGIDVLLFVRPRSKTREGKAAPFTYCGPVDFVSWDGDQPITVKWRLREAVPERLWEELRVP